MRSIIKAALRIIVVFTFLSSLNYVAVSIGNTMIITGGYPVLSYWLFFSIFYLIIFAVLILVWWKAGFLANFLAGNMDDNQLVINTPNTELFKTVVRIVGLVLFVTALPNLVGIFGEEIRRALYVIETSPIRVDKIISLIVQALLGLWLLVGSGGIVRGGAVGLGARALTSFFRYHCSPCVL